MRLMLILMGFSLLDHGKKILNNLGNRCRQLLKMVDFLYCVNEHWSANDHPETESVRHMRGVIHEWRRELEEKAGTARIA